MNPNNPTIEISIVTSVKDEEHTIGVLINQISKILDSLQINHEIIVIDHNSSDKTHECIEQKRLENPNLRTYKIRNQKIRLGQALQFGIAKAIGTYVITLDGDLSHPVKFLPIMVEHLRNGHDFVIGGRYQQNQPRFSPASRYFISKLFNTLPKILLHKQITDYTTGYRGFTRTLFCKETYYARDFSFHVEFNIRLAKNARAPIEIPITYVKRQTGKSKLKYSHQFIGYLIGIFQGLFHVDQC